MNAGTSQRARPEVRQLRIPSADSVRLVAFLLCAVMLLLPVLIRLDGHQHADWQQFLGRFHPLVVHLPIGLLLLVPLLELGGFLRPALLEAADFVLTLSVFSCLLSVFLGYLLAYGSGDAGAGVARHMWGAITLTIAVTLCTLVRATPSVRGVYPWMLTCVLLLLAWTAHQGGSLTHGGNYLTEYLPQPLRFAGGDKAQASQFPDSFYTKHLNPIFDANCVACHGEAKVKGHLRLDSYDALMRGGSDGAVVIPGHPERSTLFRRITLPPHDKKFMPSEGKPPLKPQELAWIKAWIEQGASPDTKTLVGVVTPHEDEPVPQVPDYSAKMAEIAQAAQAQGITLVPVSRRLTDGLILNAGNAGTKFGDAQLAALKPFAPYIVEAGLQHTGITDAGISVLTAFPNLRAIHLEGTQITGPGLDKLLQLKQLRYLNLSETKVTAPAAAPLRGMRGHLYLYNTPAQPENAAPAGKAS
jgi:uncharacterized membrane protein